MSQPFFHDKVVWVTGASSGIGEALTLAFSEAGARLIISARRVATLEAVRQKCAFPDKIFVLPLDLCETEAMPEKVRTAQTKWGQIDFLINNAGIGQRSHIASTAIKMYEHVMRVNFMGTVALTQAVLEVFLAQGHGHVTAISSVLGRIAVSERSSYSASKSALNAFFDTIRVEYRKQNIEVLLALSGGVKTNIDFNAMDGEGKRLGALPDDYDVAMEPAKFAKALMRAIRGRRREVVIGNMQERMGVLLRKYLPTVYHRIAP